MTSAGKYGYFVTDLRLEFDPATHRLVGEDAHNITVGNGDRGANAYSACSAGRGGAGLRPCRSAPRSGRGGLREPRGTVRRGRTLHGRRRYALRDGKAR